MGIISLESLLDNSLTREQKLKKFISRYLNDIFDVEVNPDMYDYDIQILKCDITRKKGKELIRRIEYEVAETAWPDKYGHRNQLPPRHYWKQLNILKRKMHLFPVCDFLKTHKRMEALWYATGDLVDEHSCYLGHIPNKLERYYKNSDFYGISWETFDTFYNKKITDNWESFFLILNNETYEKFGFNIVRLDTLKELRGPEQKTLNGY